MKFSFIVPSPNIEVAVNREEKVAGSCPPLGVLYLAAVLQQAGVEVSVLDQTAQGYSFRQVMKWIERENPDILGFSTLSVSGGTAAKIAKEAKRRNPDLKIVYGNHYATFNAERILAKYPQVDIIVRGEGEATALELVKCIERGHNLKKVLGITFRNKGKIVSTPNRPLIKNIDEIPFPDRSLLEAEYSLSLFDIGVAPKRFTTILSSRGCPYECKFCCCKNLFNRIWRARTVKNVFEELNMLVSEGYRNFLFVDDSFTLNQKRVIELCQLIIKEKWDIEWICEGRVDCSSYEMLRNMAKAGCKLLYFGIESANQRILDYYKKGITPQQAVKAVEKARKSGIDIIVGSFIVGAPTETRKEIINTLTFAQKIPIDIPQFNILSAAPGMEIWEELKRDGYLREEKYWETGVPVSMIHPKTLPYHEIKEMVQSYFKKFFLTRPKFLLEQAARTISSSFRLNIVLRNLPRMGAIANNLRDFSLT